MIHLAYLKRNRPFPRRPKGTSSPKGLRENVTVAIFGTINTVSLAHRQAGKSERPKRSAGVTLIRDMDLGRTEIYNHNDNNNDHYHHYTMHPFACFISMRVVAYLFPPEAPVNKGLSWY